MPLPFAKVAISNNEWHEVGKVVRPLLLMCLTRSLQVGERVTKVPLKCDQKLPEKKWVSLLHQTVLERRRKHFERSERIIGDSIFHLSVVEHFLPATLGSRRDRGRSPSPCRQTLLRTLTNPGSGPSANLPTLLRQKYYLLLPEIESGTVFLLRC